MTQEEKITSGLDKDLKQLIDIEMNDPVLGKLLNRNAAYVLGKEIKSVLIERACQWMKENLDDYLDVGVTFLVSDFKKAMQDESK
jgi:hypothetical protein